MQIDVRDIRWVESVAEGLAKARTTRQPVIFKPLGQGMGSADEW